MILILKILTYIFSFDLFYHLFIKNPCQWFLNILYKFFGIEDHKSLNLSEERLLRARNQPQYETIAREVKIGKGSLNIWTIQIKNHKSTDTPILLLHDIGYGASFWSLNLGKLALNRTVYAIDMMGFGKSSRTPFSTCPTNIELEFAKFIDAWRAEMNIKKFILLGHGFGAYVAFLYVSRFPEHTRHVVFVEPWGFEVDSKQYKKFNLSISPPNFPLSNSIKFVAFFLQFLNQYSILRFLGPGWGIDAIKKFRSDLLRQFSEITDEDTVARYLYHWNSINTPTGENAFFQLCNRSGSARHPIFFRINSLPHSLPMTFIFGSRSNFTNPSLGHQIKSLRKESYVDIQVVNGCGHYLFIEKHQLFNDLVNLICLRVDNNLDSLEVMKNDIIKSRLDFSRKRSDSSPSILELGGEGASLSRSPKVIRGGVIKVKGQYVRTRKTTVCFPITEGEEDDDDGSVDNDGGDDDYSRSTRSKMNEQRALFECGDDDDDDCEF